VRPLTSLEILAYLKPAFQADARGAALPADRLAGHRGQLLPFNAVGGSVLITSENAARRLGLRPRARLHSFAVTGDDPVYMLTGIIPATRKVLDRAGLSLADIGAFEVNEAFASVVLAWQAETGADLAKVNINGGAIALGHPLGASGARLMTTLLSVLEQTGERYGLQTMCEGGGTANATIIESL
jgi:acetyl-CoA acyltransferase